MHCVILLMLRTVIIVKNSGPQVARAHANRSARRVAQNSSVFSRLGLILFFLSLSCPRYKGIRALL